MLFGLTGSSLGLILSAFATQPWHLVVTFGLLYPLANRKHVLCAMFCHVFTSIPPVLYIPAAVLLFEWFQKRRGTASGIMFAGSGAGGTLFPFIVQALLDAFGYKLAMISLVRPYSHFLGQQRLTSTTR